MDENHAPVSNGAKLYFASDHAGFALKNALIEHFRTAGHEIEDLGAYTQEPTDDYPDFVTPCAEKVAEENARGEAARVFGVVIGGSGQGEAMCANRIPGARAAVFYGEMRVTNALDVEGGHSEDGFDIVRLARRHNDANLLSIGARFVSGNDAVEALRIFLDTEFSSNPRHARRIAKF